MTSHNSTPTTLSLVSKIKKYFTVDLWHFLDGTDKHYKFLLPLRILYQSVMEFRRGKMGMTATAMTFYTLMSIVPILAVSFAIAKGFKLDNYLEGLIYNLQEKLHFPPDIAEQILTYVDNSLQQANTAGIAGVGAIVLLWAVVRLFMVVEGTFNAIWRVRFGRSIIRCGTDYLALLFFFVIAIGVMSGVTILSKTLSEIPNTTWIPWKEDILLWGTSIFVLTLIFSAIYIAVPHTKVKAIPALVGGLFTSIVLFVLMQYAVGWVLNMGKMNAVYGSLAPLPIFLAWLHISWMIILFGAQVSFVTQNLGIFAYQKEWNELSKRERHLYVLLVLRVIAHHFEAQKGEIAFNEILKIVRLPAHIVLDALDELMTARLINQVEPRKLKDPEKYYQLACNSDQLTIAQALLGLDNKGCTLPERLKTPLSNAINAELIKMENAVQTSGNILLCDILKKNNKN